MTRRSMEPDEPGSAPEQKPGYRGGARNQTGATGVRQGGQGQPAGGEKDARGLTRDGTWEDAPPDAEGDAARGPWSVDTTPKGD